MGIRRESDSLSSTYEKFSVSFGFWNRKIGGDLLKAFRFWS